MFKFTKERIVRAWPAHVVLAADEGRTTSHEISVDLKLIETDRFHKLAKCSDEALFSEVVVGWAGIGDEKGAELKFSKKHLTALAKNAAVAKAFLSAYVKAASGEAAEKN